MVVSLLTHCGKPKSIEQNSVKLAIYPNTTALNQTREYALRGDNLFGVEVIGGPSVTVQKNQVISNGTTLKLRITVKPLEEGDPMDIPGRRLLQIRLGSEIKEVELYVLDEKRSSLQYRPESDAPSSQERFESQ